MRIILLLTYILQFQFCFSQSFTEGKFRDHFGYTISFSDDGTYEFNYSFDLARGWSVGKWNCRNDTIFLTETVVLDTLTRTSQQDSLVLSIDQTVERISEEQLAINSLSSGGQLVNYAPTKLLFRKQHLYKFDDSGRLKTKKIQGLSTKKKFDPWYFKIE